MEMKERGLLGIIFVVGAGGEGDYSSDLFAEFSEVACIPRPRREGAQQK